MSINKCIFIGNLTSDPETRRFQNGDSVANFSIALNEKFKNKQGEITENVEFVRIVLFHRLAEVAGQYLQKGSKVYIEGKLKTRKWKDQQGVERYVTEIYGSSLQMLDSRQDGQPQSPQQTTPPQNAYAQAKDNTPPPPADFDDDMPF